MTEQERELVIEYMATIGITNPHITDKGREPWRNSYGFKFYAINHAWKAVVTELKKEAYRRWINLIIKIRR